MKSGSNQVLVIFGIAVLGALLTMLTGLAGARAWDLVSAAVPSSPLPPAEATATRTPTPTRTATYTPPPCGLAWRTVPSPNYGGEYNNLGGIVATSPNDVWAVGNHNAVPLIVHWDGSQWSVQQHTLSCCGLLDVSIISDNDIWAVGLHPSARGTFTMHWNGTSWSEVPSPQFDLGGRLDGVAAVSTNNVWAVGSYNVPGIYSQTLIMHWDGSQWSVVPSPNIGNNSNYLVDLAAISATDVWAVGFCYVCKGLVYGTLTMHWDGVSWQIVESPNVGTSNHLLGVAAIATNDVWAVGSSNAVENSDPIFHWNGSKWSMIAHPPVPGGIHIEAVEARSADDVWAVGETNSDAHTATLHWNGSEWSIVPSPSPGGGGNWLYDVVPISENEAWAVGNQLASSYNTLTEHYSDPCSTQTPAPTPSLTTTPGISPTSAPTFTPTSVATSTTATPAATDTPTTIATSIATETWTATITPTPCSITFTDVHPTDYFYTAVQYLYCHGIISGYSDGTFRPYNTTTRAQLCKILALAVGWQLACPAPGHFTDVPPSDTFFCYVETAYAHQIISGYADGTFRPGNNVTRAQLCKIVVLAQGWADDCPPPGHFTDVPPTDPFFCYVETAYSHAIISGYADGTFRPGNSATRGQICKIVYQAITGP